VVEVVAVAAGDTARAIIIDVGRILLVERKRDGLSYFSIPGGGIESGETPEQTVAREISEEITITIKVDRQVYVWHEGERTHYFFLCEYIAGVPHLKVNSEEAGKGPNNTFKPVWVPLKELKDIDHPYWAPAFKELLKDVESGFSETVKVIHA